MSASADSTSSPARRHHGMRAVMTGQVGVDKKPFIERVAAIARQRGKDVAVCHVGDMMYKEAPDVAPGRILDLPRSRLNGLRRSVFKDILRIAEKAENVLVNTHATFRWKHGLFPAFDHDQMVDLDADLFMTLVDNVDSVHERLTREHDITHDLKDILVWREEEVLATEVMSSIISGHGSFYIIARGLPDGHHEMAECVYRLMFEPQRKRVYPSFPMTHVMDLPATLAEIDGFRTVIAQHFITFDPGDLDEKRLPGKAAVAKRQGWKELVLEVNGRTMTFDIEEVLRVEHDIDSQIYARDFKLIDQSDMIVSYIPQMPDGKPGLSSGVERELQHAYETTKEVFVIWKAKAEPSPFVTRTATEVVRSVEDLLKLFQSKGYIGDDEMPSTTPAPARERGRHG
ncbi:MAG TPA: AAA family ATPase [Phycisphaerae bacterium]|nr:AAA family ATPase [Phycisphaerae bacterium]